jgi:predicted RNA-binding Zn-ribbon protein involved in translation (DUF1610 family)
MSSCNHTTLILLPVPKNKLRCRHCHLVIKATDLGESYCPECFETHGRKRYEFEEIAGIETGIARYRCQECGVIIK